MFDKYPIGTFLYLGAKDDNIVGVVIDSWTSTSKGNFYIVKWFHDAFGNKKYEYSDEDMLEFLAPLD